MAQSSVQTMIINTDVAHQTTTLITPLSAQGEELHLLDNSQPPSLESILSGSSLAPYSRVAFSNFLKKIHCSENLDFLLNSNQYLIRCSERVHESDSESQQLWLFIYNNYISSDSLKEVNIPHDLREALTDHFESDTLPDVELIERTMISIKELLRDGYLQFIQSVKKHQLYFADKVNENYSLLPTPVDDIHSPSPKNLHLNILNQSLNHRRFSESCSPLDPSTNQTSSSRCVSPLSDSEITFTPNNVPASNQQMFHEIPRSVDIHESCNESSNSSVDVDFSSKKNSSVSTTSSKGKNSISEASIGLKKLAGKLRWRRMSSNSSTSSSN